MAHRPGRPLQARWHGPAAWLDGSCQHAANWATWDCVAVPHGLETSYYMVLQRHTAKWYCREDQLALMPEGMGFEEAAATPLVALTAWQASAVVAQQQQQQR